MYFEPYEDATFQCYTHIRTLPVPRSKLSASVIKPNLLMTYKAKVTVWPEIHTKHINAM